MNKPNTPKDQKPSTASNSNNSTIKVTTHIARWDPARDYIDPATIESSKAQAVRLFHLLARGYRIHRMNADEFGFVKNFSLHSAISQLEAMYDLPVERQLITLANGAKVKEYFFSETTIAALQQPERRKAIGDEFRRFKEFRFFSKVFKAFKNCLFILLVFSALLKRNPVFRNELIQIKEQITRVLDGGVK